MSPADNGALPELIIFDCDGVLVDSEPLSNAVLGAAICGLGLPVSIEDTRARYQGWLIAEVGDDIARRTGRPVPDGFWDQFDADRRDAFHRSLTAVAGAAEAVSAVQAAGIRTCVASQGSVAKTQMTLGLTGLRPLFADGELFSADHVARGKPFPDLFLHAAATLGTAPAQCLVVEDSLTGIAAARAAGMAVIAYAAAGAPPLTPDPPAPTIDRLPELLVRLSLS